MAAYPELIRAAEGPVMDSSAACLMRLARAVHDQGYKVVLTGEGADEALAGYAWFKTQKIRDAVSWGPMVAGPEGRAKPGSGLDRRHGPPARHCWGFEGRAPPSKTFTTSWARPGRCSTRTRSGTAWPATPPTTTWISPTTASAAGIR